MNWTMYEKKNNVISHKHSIGFKRVYYYFYLLWEESRKILSNRKVSHVLTQKVLRTSIVRLQTLSKLLIPSDVSRILSSTATGTNTGLVRRGRREKEDKRMESNYTLNIKPMYNHCSTIASSYTRWCFILYYPKTFDGLLWYGVCEIFLADKKCMEMTPDNWGRLIS